MMVYIGPLISDGRLAMTEHDNPKSRNQKYITVNYEALCPSEVKA